MKSVRDEMNGTAFRSFAIPEIPEFSAAYGKVRVVLRIGGSTGVAEPHIIAIISQEIS